MKKRKNEPENKELKESVSYCESNYDIVDYNRKLYVRIIIEVKSSAYLVECMRKKGKRHKNGFSWQSKIKDQGWYQISDIISLACLVNIEGMTNTFMLDDKS